MLCHRHQQKQQQQQTKKDKSVMQIQKNTRLVWDQSHELLYDGQEYRDQVT